MSDTHGNVTMQDRMLDAALMEALRPFRVENLVLRRMFGTPSCTVWGARNGGAQLDIQVPDDRASPAFVTVREGEAPPVTVRLSDPARATLPLGEAGVRSALRAGPGLAWLRRAVHAVLAAQGQESPFDGRDG